jgi:hypothetical protein
MKRLFCLILSIAIIACVSSRNSIQSIRKLEIIKTDTIRGHYVFKTKDELDSEIIVLAESEKVEGCKPFKRFIIADSIHQVSAIKSGSRYDLIGFTVSIVDGIKIRDSAELVKIIWNCNCFTDK